MFLLLTLALSPPAQSQPSSLARDDFWVPDGEVKAVVETNGVVYIGGLFDYVSPVDATGRAFDLASAGLYPDFPKFKGAIKAIVGDDAGGWFVGGLFPSVGGLPVTNVAHIRADRTVDANWSPNPDQSVLTLVLSGGVLYVGGTFSRIAGQPHSLLAALDPVTGLSINAPSGQPWRADVASFVPDQGSVNALAVGSGRLFIGGYFSTINGHTNEHIGSVDAMSGVTNSWFPNGYTGAEAGARIDALAVSGNVIYVGGTFSSIGSVQSLGVPRHFLAALDTTKDLGASVLPWNPDANGPVSCFALTCDTLYVGGSFTTMGGFVRNRLAAVDLASGQVKPWDPNANGPVLSLLLSGKLIYAGGKFTQVGGLQRQYLAALDLDTAETTLWNPTADFGVAGLAISGGIFVSGGSLGPGGLPRKNLAAFDAKTGKPTDWNPQISGFTVISGSSNEGVKAICALSNMIYFGGPFTSVNGQTRNHAGAVDAISGVVSPWNPNADGVVETLLSANGVIYAGGLISSIGGQLRNNLAALDPISGLVTAWNPAPDNKITALAAQGTNIYCGGRFAHISGQPRRGLAAVSASTGAASAWNPGVDAEPESISFLGNSVYLAGQFGMISTQAVYRLGAVDIVTGNLTCWQPNPQAVTSAGKTNSGAVNAVAVSSNAVYAGGSFTLIGGQPRNNLASLGTNCPGAPTAWDPNLDKPVNKLALSRNAAYAVGTFELVGGGYHPHFAVFPPVGFPFFTLQPLTQLVPVGSNVLLQVQASGQTPLFYQWQLNGTNILHATNLTLALNNVQVTNSGTYSVIVTNILGLVHSRPAVLTVVQPAAILAQPLSQTVASGTTVTLSVSANGNPPPTYQWRLNGVNIPGAIYSTLVLPNAQPTDGGNYSVLVANIGGLTNSSIATVLVTSPAITLADNLGSRLVISAAFGTNSSSNIGATKELGEPNHAGKVGGPSVWLGWHAPMTGIATFSTRGSSFDTLLGIYTGTNVATLSSITSDDDRGDFATSQASFNAIGGTDYLIAIDGYAGAMGNIVLSWNLDTTIAPFPRIINQPVSETVSNGATATFSVQVAASPSPVTFQWFFGCSAIVGATSSNLVILNVQPSDVGNYRVFVMNASSKVARSLDVFLEIGTDLKGFSEDKWEDLLFGLGAGPHVESKASPAGLGGGGSGFIPVFAGTIGSQLFNNAGATAQQGEPSHCGVIGGSSRWFGLQPQNGGTMMIDTIGSSFDTVLAVYTGTNSILTLHSVACDDNGAPDGIRSLVVFTAQPGTNYSVAVDGVNGAQGAINLTWRLENGPPAPLCPTTNVLVSTGSSLMLSACVNALPPLSYQWLFNGHLMIGQTASMLRLANVQGAQAGTYSVIASNFAGIVTNTVAVIKVGAPIPLSYGWVHTNNQTLFHVYGASGQRFLLQGSSNLISWDTLYSYTNSPAGAPIDYRDPQTPSNRKRFYRVLPWP